MVAQKMRLKQGPARAAQWLGCRRGGLLAATLAIRDKALNARRFLLQFYRGC
jgi:hypothetical protein